MKSSVVVIAVLITLVLTWLNAHPISKVARCVSEAQRICQMSRVAMKLSSCEEAAIYGKCVRTHTAALSDLSLPPFPPAMWQECVQRQVVSCRWAKQFKATTECGPSRYEDNC